MQGKELLPIDRNQQEDPIDVSNLSREEIIDVIFGEKIRQCPVCKEGTMFYRDVTTKLNRVNIPPWFKEKDVDYFHKRGYFCWNWLPNNNSQYFRKRWDGSINCDIE